METELSSGAEGLETPPETVVVVEQTPEPTPPVIVPSQESGISAAEATALARNEAQMVVTQLQDAMQLQQRLDSLHSSMATLQQGQDACTAAVTRNNELMQAIADGLTEATEEPSPEPEVLQKQVATEHRRGLLDRLL